MIFVTTGTQEPFDRLIKTVDEIAYMLPDVRFIVQAIRPTYITQNFEVLDFISPAEFEGYVKECELIISHAGMGTIISALVNNKPIIVLPRSLDRGEHRNDHQLATAKKLEVLSYVNVAYNETDLKTIFFEQWPDKLKSLHKLGNVASKNLIDSLNNFIKE